MTEIIRANIFVANQEIINRVLENDPGQLLGGPSILHFTTSKVKERLLEATNPLSLPIAHIPTETYPGERMMEQAHRDSPNGLGHWRCYQYLPSLLAAHKMKTGLLEVREYVDKHGLIIGDSVFFMGSDTGILDENGNLVAKPLDFDEAMKMLRGLHQVTQQASIVVSSAELGCRIGMIATPMVRKRMSIQEAEQYLSQHLSEALTVAGAVPITGNEALDYYDIPPEGLVSKITVHDLKKNQLQTLDTQTHPKDQPRIIQLVYGYDPDLLRIMLAEDIEKQ